MVKWHILTIAKALNNKYVKLFDNLCKVYFTLVTRVTEGWVQELESICLVFNDERKSDIDFINQLLDDMENAEAEAATQIKESLRKIWLTSKMLSEDE